MGTARLKRYSKSPPGHRLGSTQNVCRIQFFFLHPLYSHLLTPPVAVVLANVLGYFDPVRALIQGAIRDGFIQPVGVDLVKFVDGPSDHSLHESFDWGQALLDQLGSWKGDPSYSLGFDWTRPKDGGESTEALNAT